MNIDNIDFLVNIKHLKTLSIENCKQIIDFADLSKLINLDVLSLNLTNIMDILFNNIM